MNSLIEIAEKQRRADEELMLLGGELSPEMEKELQKIDTELLGKADAYSFILLKAQASIADFKNREDQYRSARKALETAVERIKDRIKYAMKLMEKTEIIGNEVKFTLSNSKASLVIENEKEVPKEFKKEIITTVIDKELIRGALESGILVAGAKLEQGSALRINTGPRKEL